MLVTWKLRARPRRAMRYGRSPAISRPWRRIEPCEGTSRPLIRLKSVDLPAPLGPMIAWRSPSGIASDTPRMISVAPKLLRTASSATAASAIGVASRQGAVQPGDAAGEQHDRDQPRPRLRSIHLDPEELHERARLGLRRAPVRDLDQHDRAQRP